jgi:hypothetical protein
MNQKSRPRKPVRAPNYPPLSVLAIAAALAGCNGETLESDGDGGPLSPHNGVGGATALGTATTAPYPELQGSIAPSFGGAGGATTTAPEIVSQGDIAAPFGGAGGTGSATSVGTVTTVPIPELQGTIAPSYGGAGGVTSVATKTSVGGAIGTAITTIPGLAGGALPEYGGAPNLGTSTSSPSSSVGGSSSAISTPTPTLPTE